MLSPRGSRASSDATRTEARALRGRAGGVRLAALLLALALIGSAGAAQAGHHEAGEGAESMPAEAQATESGPELGADQGLAAEHGRSSGGGLYEPWRYNTDFFFQLTRGLPESGASERSQPYWKVLTIPGDVITLPGAAIAGLFG